jgi:D-glycero-D-manno-heptose 1,7-bisphosphate phosphatase
MTPHGRGGKRRAVFLDRDGVINRSQVRGGKPYAPRKVSEFRLLPGVAGAVAELKAAGYLVIVVTNKPDLGHGLISGATLDAMHERLRQKVAVDDIYVCPHRQDEGCSCRKPKPGLMRRAMARWGIAPAGSIMVGDRWNDVVAGKKACLYTAFIDRHYAEPLVEEPDLTARSLPHAVAQILTLRRGENRCRGLTG